MRQFPPLTCGNSNSPRSFFIMSNKFPFPIKMCIYVQAAYLIRMKSKAPAMQQIYEFRKANMGSFRVLMMVHNTLLDTSDIW